MSLYLKDYQQQALQTALPTAFQYDYLINGIFSETGELVGKYAKAARDQWTEARLFPELVAEYGDICWPAAVYLHWRNINEIEDRQLTVYDALCDDDPVTDLTGWAANAVAEHRAREFTVLDLTVQRLWVALERHAKAITGQPFQVVLDYNIHKLADRQSRKVLQGSGDNR